MRIEPVKTMNKTSNTLRETFLDSQIFCFGPCCDSWLCARHGAIRGREDVRSITGDQKCRLNSRENILYVCHSVVLSVLFSADRRLVRRHRISTQQSLHQNGHRIRLWIGVARSTMRECPLPSQRS